jgi:hypothetical protein
MLLYRLGRYRDAHEHPDRAEKFLKGTQDAEDKERLLVCAGIVMRRLADVN